MKILFLDWNGTLIDDMHVWDRARKATFLKFGVEPPSIADYFTELEDGDYLNAYRKRGIVASRDELNSVYESVYEAHAKDAELFPRIKESLQELRRLDFSLHLVTAHKEYLAAPFLDRFGIADFFERCNYAALNKSEIISTTLTGKDANRGSCYFIGDTPSDILHGKKAGVKTVGILNDAYIPDKLLFRANADYYLYNVSDFPILLENLD